MAKKQKNSDHERSIPVRERGGDDESPGRDETSWRSKPSVGPSYSKWSEKYDAAIARDTKGSGAKDNDEEDASIDLRGSRHDSIAMDEEYERLSAKIDDAIASALQDSVLFREKEEGSSDIARPAAFAAETPTLSGELPETTENERISAQVSKKQTLKETKTPIDLTDASIARKMKTGASAVAGKKIGAPSAPSDEEIAIKASPEELSQLEQEMTIDTNVDRCIVCKKELAGDVFICPNCKNAKYHRSCIEALVANGEPCWVCQNHIISPQDEKEVKALQLRLNYITKAIEDLNAQFKSGEISDETFTETFNQFKQDKDAIEKQISAKLKKEPQSNTDNES